MSDLQSVPEKAERRENTEPEILWLTEKIIINNDIKDKRLNADTVRAIRNLYHMAKNREAQGLIFVAACQDGNYDIGITGKFFNSPIQAEWAVRRLLKAIEGLPNHPDQQD